jgi:hypothetical protein
MYSTFYEVEYYGLLVSNKNNDLYTGKSHYMRDKIRVHVFRFVPVVFSKRIFVYVRT